MTAWRDESESVTDSPPTKRGDDAESPGDGVNDRELAEEVIFDVHPRIHRGSVQTMRFSDDDQQLATGATDGSHRHLRTPRQLNGREPRHFPTSWPVNSFMKCHQSNIADMISSGPKNLAAGDFRL